MYGMSDVQYSSSFRMWRVMVGMTEESVGVLVMDDTSMNW